MAGENIIRFEDVDGKAIRFRNFSGKPGKFNAEGCRNFCLIIDPETADAFSKDGWNVRWLNPRNEDEEPLPYLPVEVSFGKGRPPKVVQVTKHGQTKLNEKTVSNLDYAEIESADIALNPYHWEVAGKSGIKAYLKTMYAKLAEDDFEDKYYDVPDSAVSSVDEAF